jgi:hypothetical protein
VHAHNDRRPRHSGIGSIEGTGEDAHPHEDRNYFGGHDDPVAAAEHARRSEAVAVSVDAAQPDDEPDECGHRRDA